MGPTAFRMCFADNPAVSAAGASHSDQRTTRFGSGSVRCGYAACVTTVRLHEDRTVRRRPRSPRFPRWLLGRGRRSNSTYMCASQSEPYGVASAFAAVQDPTMNLDQTLT